MSAIVRASKFRHVFGEPKKAELCYSGVNAHAGTPEGNGLAGNTKFVAVSWNTGGGGALAVLPHDKAARLGSSVPLLKGHSAPILDFDFSPFDDHQVATGSEDNTARVWQIPEGGLTQDMSDPLVVLEGHQKKVHIISYHKVASNIITTASHDHSIKIWDLTRGAAALSFDGLFTDTVWSVNWNRQGNLFVASSKDKTVRIFDPRNKATEISSWQAHEGSKPCKALWLGRRDKILTLGFNKQSSRQLTLWDPRNVSVPLHNIDIDIAAGVFMPMYDDDSNVLYLAGKGDTSIKFYEFVDEAPYMFYLSSFVGTKPQKSACLLPKMAGDILKCEVGRIIRNTGDTLEVVSMTVPRKASDFQEDIFPETAAPRAALTGDQWLAGQTSDPVMMSCRPGEGVAEAPKPQAKTVFQLQKEADEKDARIAALEAEIEQLRKKLAKA
jgi:hypothetical protein